MLWAQLGGVIVLGIVVARAAAGHDWRVLWHSGGDLERSACTPTTADGDGNDGRRRADRERLRDRAGDLRNRTATGRAPFSSPEGCGSSASSSSQGARRAESGLRRAPGSRCWPRSASAYFRRCTRPARGSIVGLVRLSDHGRRARDRRRRLRREHPAWPAGRSPSSSCRCRRHTRQLALRGLGRPRSRHLTSVLASSTRSSRILAALVLKGAWRDFSSWADPHLAGVRLISA